jgi:phosphoribosylaminoimidazole-succinocarboxamide synthase
VVVKRLKPLPIEAVVRGYVIGSGWKDYQQTGAICGIALPAGLKMAAKLPPRSSPRPPRPRSATTTNVSYEQARQLRRRPGRGPQGHRQDRRPTVRRSPRRRHPPVRRSRRRRHPRHHHRRHQVRVRHRRRRHAAPDRRSPDAGLLRFWPADQYVEGQNPPSYDKQYVRDYLETLDWGKVAPGPKLPADVIARTSAKYIEAYEKLTGKTL